jgi:DNA-directed RNA polymerase subunit M/transcription elongation factor TFIIS
MHAILDEKFSELGFNGDSSLLINFLEIRCDENEFKIMFIKLVNLINKSLYKELIEAEVYGGDGLTMSEFISKSDMELRPDLFTVELDLIKTMRNVKLSLEPIDHYCPACKNDKAFYERITKCAIDEPKKTYYICTKCRVTST